MNNLKLLFQKLQIEIPPLKNDKKPSRKIVFVDPDDENLSWWWPALVLFLLILLTIRSFLLLNTLYSTRDWTI